MMNYDEFSSYKSVVVSVLFLVNEVFMNHMNQMERMNNDMMDMKQLPGYPPPTTEKSDP